MKILVMNCGSSSLKYQLIDMDNESVLAKGLCERIGIPGSKLTHKPAGKEKFELETEMKDHGRAVELVLEALSDPVHGVISSPDEIGAIGHRVLHGGPTLTKSCVVDQHVKDVIRECFDLGPLHNPANLIGIEACEKAMPGKKNVAVFDTSFGMGMEPKAYRYAIPDKYYEKYKDDARFTFVRFEDKGHNSIFNDPSNTYLDELEAAFAEWMKTLDYDPDAEENKTQFKEDKAKYIEENLDRYKWSHRLDESLFARFLDFYDHNIEEKRQ